MASKKSVILGVSGSIAAVKSPELARLLIEKGFEVDCVLTESAQKFVTPLSLATLTGRPAHCRLFEKDAFEMPHLALARKADLLLAAPASASLLASLAQGLASDLITLTYLSTKAPLLAAPAMHDTMWDHPAVQAQVEILKSRGVSFVGPVKGRLADATEGTGRMADLADIVQAALKLVNT